jgi:hypothetical protein
LAYLENPVNRFGITLELSTGEDVFSKLSLFDFGKKGGFHTQFDSHQVVEIKVENTLFHME